MTTTGRGGAPRGRKKRVAIGFDVEHELDIAVRARGRRLGVSRQEVARRILSRFLRLGGERTRRLRMRSESLEVDRCLLEQLVGDTFGGAALDDLSERAERHAARRAESLYEDAYVRAAAAAAAGRG